MTRPVQIAFVLESGRPKIFLRTLLYTTGKRGYFIEGLYVKIRRGKEHFTFGFWGYGEREELMAAGGLRIDETGVAYNHHFLQLNRESGFRFDGGKYEIDVYANVVNHDSARILHRATLILSDQLAAILERSHGVLFTWNPDEQDYYASISPRR
jgi:hypothetical protein